MKYAVVLPARLIIEASNQEGAEQVAHGFLDRFIQWVAHSEQSPQLLDVELLADTYIAHLTEEEEAN